MAKVTGPLMSISAKGTIAKALTFCTVYGIQYVREWFKPGNPKTALQVNVRTALSIMVADWKIMSGADQLLWDAAAASLPMSGYAYYQKRGLTQYPIQLTTAVTPASTSYVGDEGSETWTWVAVA